MPTTAPIPLIPRRFAKCHQISGFDSSEPEINRYLIKDARDHARAGFSITWVTTEPTDHTILGYVSLSAASQPALIKDKHEKKRLLTYDPKAELMSLS